MNTQQRCQQILETFGEVSLATAWARVSGVLANSDADVAVATTGIAGPGGGSLLPVRQQPAPHLGQPRGPGILLVRGVLNPRASDRGRYIESHPARNGAGRGCGPEKGGRQLW